MGRPATIRLAALVLAAAVSVAGCRSRPLVPDLAALYRQAASENDPVRDPVVVIPGILGTRLEDPASGRTIWGAFAGDFASPRTPEGARLLAHPMGLGRPLEELRDGADPVTVLDRVRVRVLGIPVTLRAYVDILATLGIGGYRDETLGRAGAIRYSESHYTCFQFAYDWRRDNIENAQKLHGRLLALREYVRQTRKERGESMCEPVRFDLVAHSMGGLVVRYFLRYGGDLPPEDGSVPWTGAELVDQVFLIASPNAGSADALLQLVRGKNFAIVLPRFPPALLGTLPALYQLLPRPRHGAVIDAETGEPVRDFLEPEFFQARGFALSDPRQEHVLSWLLPEVADPIERRRIALDHQRKCLERAKLFFRALDAPAEPPGHLEIVSIIGDAKPTVSKVAVEPGIGRVRVVDRAPGDGVVLRSSALLDERVGRPWQPGLRSPIRHDEVLFFAAEHLELTRDPGFVDNLLFRLLEASAPEGALEPGGTAP